VKRLEPFHLAATKRVSLLISPTSVSLTDRDCALTRLNLACIGIMLATVSYKNLINLCVGSDSAWLSKAELKEILNEIPHVLNQLADGASSSLSKETKCIVPETLYEELSDGNKEEKSSVSDRSELSAQSQENLTDPAHKDDENQNQIKKKRTRTRSRNKKTAAGTKVH